jgi:hypothetical protein
MPNPVRDVFICHASENKDDVVRPLVQALSEAGVSCWYDEAEIQWGDSITPKVNEGLTSSKICYCGVQSGIRAEKLAAKRT